MNRIIGNIPAAFFCLAVLPAALHAQDNWKHEYTKEGISVYTRAAVGSSLKEFKGEGLVDAPLEVCRNVLMDVESQPKWQPDCTEVVVLKTEENAIIAYTTTDAPWPARNRDVITRTEVRYTENGMIFSFTGIDDPGLVPLRKDWVRITDIHGMWILVRKGDKTYATYQAKVNPGGAIPAWLANTTVTKQAFESLMGLRKMVLDPQYGIQPEQGKSE